MRLAPKIETGGDFSRQCGLREDVESIPSGGPPSGVRKQVLTRTDGNNRTVGISQASAWPWCRTIRVPGHDWVPRASPVLSCRLFSHSPPSALRPPAQVSGSALPWFHWAMRRRRVPGQARPANGDWHGLLFGGRRPKLATKAVERLPSPSAHAHTHNADSLARMPPVRRAAFAGTPPSLPRARHEYLRPLILSFEKNAKRCAVSQAGLEPPQIPDRYEGRAGADGAARRHAHNSTPTPRPAFCKIWVGDGPGWAGHSEALSGLCSVQCGVVVCTWWMDRGPGQDRGSPGAGSGAHLLSPFQQTLPRTTTLLMPSTPYRCRKGGTAAVCVGEDCYWCIDAAVGLVGGGVSTRCHVVFCRP